jgi:tRNA (uracil-5-)-methyltransferase TRM9
MNYNSYYLNTKMELKEIYESIADSFDKTRVKVWPCVERFLDSIETHKYGLEVGCGNGKNMFYRKDLKLKGIDICSKFYKKCLTKGLDVDIGDMLALPYEDKTFDFVYSVAVLHHLATEKLRMQAIQEMIRVCKPTGKIFILVWAFEQEPSSKRKFKKQDVLVPWNDSKNNNKIAYRFYHVYIKDELEKEVYSASEEVIVKESFYEKGNWGIIIQKLLF